MIWRPRLSRPALAAAATGFASLAIYLVTLAPTVLIGDDGELVAAAHVLGIGHPTGYPLYLLMAKLFDLIPFGSSPIKIGVFSALAGAGAAAAIGYAAVVLTDSLPAGLLAGAVAALNRPLWSEATHVEVYALNALFISLSIAVFAHWSRKRRAGQIVWLALLAGLGLTHHRSAIFFTAPALAVAVILQRPPARALAKACLTGVLPLLLYLYLPLRAAARPPVQWSDLTRWDEFAAYVSARNYYDLYAFKRPLSEIASVGKDFLLGFGGGLTPGGAVLVAIGIVVLLFRNRRVSAVLLIGTSLTALWNLGYRVEDWLPYFAPCYLAAGIWAAVGLDAVAKAVRSTAAIRSPYAASAVTALALVFVPASLLQSNWSKAGHRGEWKGYDQVNAMIAQIPPGGILITNRDTDLFIPMYQQVVEGRRPDLLVLSIYGSYDGVIHDPMLEAALTPLIEHHAQHPALTDEQDSLATLSIGIAAAEATGWRRPVFCAVNLSEPPSDPRVLSLWSDYFQITRSHEQVVAPIPPGARPADFGNGVALVRASVGPATVRPGEQMRAMLLWALSQPLDKPPFVLLRLKPAGAPERSPDPSKMLLKYGAWLAAAEGPIFPTQPGLALRQEVSMICPTNAPPGPWELWLGTAAGSKSAISTRVVGRWEVAPHNRPRR